MFLAILLLFAILAYLTFIIMIFIGGAYITKILFNSTPEQLECINLTKKDDLNIAKMTIILFWIVFIPLCMIPLVFCTGYCKYILH